MKLLRLAEVGVAAIGAWAVLQACGPESKRPGTPPGNPLAYRQGSYSCSTNFISDYNTVNTRLGFVNSDSAEALVAEFSSKYQNVVCSMGLITEKDPAGKPVVIIVDKQAKVWRDSIKNKKPTSNLQSSYLRKQESIFLLTDIRSFRTS